MSNLSDSSGGSLPPVRLSTLKAELNALDLLPPTLRNSLKSRAHRWSALDILRLHRKGLPTAFILHYLDTKELELELLYYHAANNGFRK